MENQWVSIFATPELRKSGYLPHGRRQGRSLYVRLHGPGTLGKWTDASVGIHGDLLDIIRHRIGAPTLGAALDEARALLALPPAPAEGGSGTYDAVEAARRLPPLVAAVTDGEGAVLGVQRTWLDPRAPAKARLASPRKALGRIFGHAVRFGRPSATLLVGEGIETVLSAVAAVPDIEAAAALSAGSLGAFAPPAGVRRLVIARDNDIEGERAAERLARRCARAGVLALTAVPEAGDFNDDLMLLGPAALAAKLGPLFRGQVRNGE